jgi:outer membrane protein TolC
MTAPSLRRGATGIRLLAAHLLLVAPAHAQNPPPAPESTQITLDAAVRRALAGSPTLEETAALIRRAEGAVAEARSLRLPQVTGTARFLVQGPIPTFEFTRPPSTPGGMAVTEEITFGRTFTRSFSAAASYDVDPFGRRRDNLRAAGGSLMASLGSHLAARNELVYAVQSVYLAGLRARELIAVAREAVDAAAEQLRVAQAQFRAGVAPEFDVLRASVQVENNRQTLTTAQANYRRTLAALAQLLSLNEATPLDLAPVQLPADADLVAIGAAMLAVDDAPAVDPPPAGRSPLPGSLEQALQEAFDHRPEIYRDLWTRRSAEHRQRQQSKGRRPDLSLQAGFSYDPDLSGFAVEKLTWSVVANVSIPIWDAGLTRARTRQAAAEVGAADARLKRTRDAVVEDVRTALVDLEEARERRRTAAANTSQAREALRIARVRYTAGLSQTVEVTDAEVALTQARTNEVNAAYDFISALANLNRSLGRYAGDSLTRSQPAPGR